MTARSGPLRGSVRRWVFCRGPESGPRSLGQRRARVVQRCQPLSVPLPAGSAAGSGTSLPWGCHRRGVRMGLLSSTRSQAPRWPWGTSPAPAVVAVVFPAWGHFCSARTTMRCRQWVLTK